MLEMLALSSDWDWRNVTSFIRTSTSYSNTEEHVFYDGPAFDRIRAQARSIRYAMLLAQVTCHTNLRWSSAHLCILPRHIPVVVVMAFTLSSQVGDRENVCQSDMVA